MDFKTLQESALAEIANIGLGHASTALSELLSTPFQMEIPRVERHLVTGAEACWEADMVAVGVLVPFVGEADGNLAFIMPFSGGQALCRALIGSAPESPTEVGELEASVLLEFGNILNSAFLRAIADMTGLELHSTPPMVGIDLGRSLLASVSAQAELMKCAALSVDTRLRAEGGLELEGTFYCLPSQDGLTAIFARLGLAEAA
jgi:chemotaxis protein CheC